MYAKAVQPLWHETEREFGTLWCETQVQGVEVWLEWNDRVMAYRFGFSLPADAHGERQSTPSTCGFCPDLQAAKQLVLEAVRAVTHGSSSDPGAVVDLEPR